MNPLSDSALLDAWETAAAATPAERPLVLLAAAEMDASINALDQLSIPERDARLLSLREAIFGPGLQSVVACEHCGERVEIVFETSDVQVGRSPSSPLTFRAGGYAGTFRLPVSADWVVLANAVHGGSSSRETASVSRDDLRHAVARRCLLTFAPESSSAAIDLPDEALDAVADAIAQVDADAHTELSVACPSCGHEWATLFDIASFLWGELDAHCRRLIDDVHRMARAYGWTESEILRLTPVRRTRYLELIDHE